MHKTGKAYKLLDGAQREEVVNKLKRLPPLEKDPAWKQLHEPDDWGVADASERIDEVLYGALVT